MAKAVALAGLFFALITLGSLLAVLLTPLLVFLAVVLFFWLILHKPDHPPDPKD